MNLFGLSSVTFKTLTVQSMHFGSTALKEEIDGVKNKHHSTNTQLENGSLISASDSQSMSIGIISNIMSDAAAILVDENIAASSGKETDLNEQLMNEPHGIPCMLEIFHFCCSLLNVAEHMGMSPRSNTIAFDEDVPLFALTLINSSIELRGSSFHRHPRLLIIIQDELFCNLMQFGLSMKSSIARELHEYHTRVRLPG